MRATTALALPTKHHRRAVRGGVAVAALLGLLLVPAGAGAFPHAPPPVAAGAGSKLSPIRPVALTPSTGELPRWGAIYATASAVGFGLTVGLADRQEARRGAESQCRTAGAAAGAAAGAQCQLLAEFAERCAAVAQGVQRRAVRTTATRRSRAARPPGFVVISVAAGAGRTAEEAESAALEACERIDDGRGFCLVAASACSTTARR